MPYAILYVIGNHYAMRMQLEASGESELINVNSAWRNEMYARMVAIARWRAAGISLGGRRGLPASCPPPGIHQSKYMNRPR